MAKSLLKNPARAAQGRRPPARGRQALRSAGPERAGEVDAAPVPGGEGAAGTRGGGRAAGGAGGSFFPVFRFSSRFLSFNLERFSRFSVFSFRVFFFMS